MSSIQISLSETSDGMLKVEAYSDSVTFNVLGVLPLVDFNNPKRVIDLSYLIKGVEKDKNDVVTVIMKPSDLDKNCLSGVIKVIVGGYYVDSEDNTLYSQVEDVYIDFKYFESCLINKILSVEYDGCGPKIKDCEDCEENPFMGFVLLDTYKTLLTEELYSEAARIEEALDLICSECYPCNLSETIKNHDSSSVLNLTQMGSIIYENSNPAKPIIVIPKTPEP